jgi:DNA-directed RNA polymerase specialized sigma24 family protein
MTGEAETISRILDEANPVTLRPLTRVKATAVAVQRAEQALHRARLAHADAIIAAHDAGHSYAAIGYALGITRGRVHQLVTWRKEQRHSKKGATRG